MSKLSRVGLSADGRGRRGSKYRNYVAQEYTFSAWEPLHTVSLQLKQQETEENCIIRRFIRGPFEKFADSPYYSQSKQGGATVTVPFSKYVPWQVMHFLQSSIHFSKT
jgi:hypothetical protein